MTDNEAFDLLARADKSYNAGTIGIRLAQIVDASRLNLADCELMLREMGSQTHLVAWPKAMMPPEVEARSIKTQEPVGHAVWICLHGRGEAAARFQEWGIADMGENLKHLETAGFSMPTVSIPQKHH